MLRTLRRRLAGRTESAPSHPSPRRWDDGASFESPLGTVLAGPGCPHPPQQRPSRSCSSPAAAAPRHPGERIIGVHDELAVRVAHASPYAFHDSSPDPRCTIAAPDMAGRAAATRGDAADLACAIRACSRPVGRACMAPCHRIRMIRGGILAYSASYARGCACLGAVVVWCGARTPRPRNAWNTRSYSMPCG